MVPVGADETAEEAFGRGVTHYEAGQLDRAAAAFEQAYELEPKPVYLFSWAQSEVGRDRCAEAIEIFRRYLATSPPAANRRAAEQRILTCEERLDEAPSPSAPAAPTDAGTVGVDGTPAAATTADAAPRPAARPSPAARPPAGPSPTATPTPAEAPTAVSPPEPVATDRWWTDPFGMSLLGAGVVATGIGTGVLVWGEKTLASASDQRLATYDDHDQTLAAGRRRRVAGGIVLGVGVALISGGVIRAITFRGEPSAEPTGGAGLVSESLWISPLAPAAGVQGRF